MLFILYIKSIDFEFVNDYYKLGMYSTNYFKKTAILIFFVILISLFLYGLYLFYQLNTLRNSKIRIISEVPEASFKLTNKGKLLEYLDKFSFWEGVIENPTITENMLQVKPKALVIHISDKEYSNNKISWTGKIYAAGTNGKIDNKDIFHLWIGLNKGFFNGTYDGLENWIDSVFLTGIFTRSVKTRHFLEEVIKNHILEKRKTQPFITIESKNK